MTDDLVKRLRDLAECAVDVAPYEVMTQAADRIEELEAALRKLITHTLDCEKRLDEFHGLGGDAGSGMSSVVCEARAALEKKDD